MPIIRLIARDGALHLTGTRHMLNLMRSGDDDPDMAKIAEECREQSIDLFVRAAEQKKMGRLSVQGRFHDRI